MVTVHTQYGLLTPPIEPAHIAFRLMLRRAFFVASFIILVIGQPFIFGFTLFIRTRSSQIQRPSIHRLFVSQSSLDPPLKHSDATTTMGAQFSTKTVVVEQKKSKRAYRKGKIERAAEKRKETDAFVSQVLDPAYVNLPLRNNTVEAAALYPSATIGASTLLPGSHKHLGGAYDPTDGCIYGVPANSPSILCLHPTTTANNGSVESYEMTAIPLPERIRSQEFKWLRGIFAHGYLWAIPSWADCVLCVDVDAYWGRRQMDASTKDVVQLLELPDPYKNNTNRQWQWHGAGINQEQTAIYCIPSNAQHVLRVDCQTKQTSLISIDATGYPQFDPATPNKWYGGIRGADNCVYGIPYRSCAVLRIDPSANTARLIGPDYGVGRYNWHGGIAVNGKIYAHPSHAKTVLVLDTTSSTTKVYELPIPGYESSTETYKWLGGALGADGNIYCPACDTTAILKINVTTEECETYGATGDEKNKWQGGMLARDGCIYCIPASGRQVCRIAPQAVQLIGDLPLHKDKWQGGHVGKDGCLYFIPENGYRVLKVIPPKEPPIVTDGKLPSGDVRLEMM